MRGLAALAVVVFHIRNRYFLDYDLLLSPGVFSKAFYSLSAFGHDAVMVFFVLSGYLISSTVMRDVAHGQWSWSRYAVNRLTRLYVVLLPGLLLTLFWDGLRRWLFPGGPIFIGDRQEPWMASFFPLPRNLGLEVAGNAVFLQTIVVFPLGSNGALWSLSYEFWYYVLFPLVLYVWHERRRALTTMALVAAILLLVGVKIALYFPVWLLGTAVYLMPAIDRWKRVHPRAVAAGALSLFMLIVGFTHTDRFAQWAGASESVSDYVTAIAFAFALYVLIHNQAPSKADRYQWLGATLAGFSYTLYVTHLPLLVFIRGAVPAPLLPGASAYAFALGLAVAAIAYAYVVSLVTEARTDAVRKAVWQMVGRQRIRLSRAG